MMNNLRKPTSGFIKMAMKGYHSLVTKPVLSASELREMILAKQKGVKVLNCTWRLGDPNFCTASLNEKSRIPGALPFDLSECRKQDTEHALMLPEADHFAQYIRSLGLAKGDTLVCYDEVFVTWTSPWVYWMLRSFGFEDVYVLNGGFKHWVDLGYETESGPAENFKPVKEHEDIILNDEHLKRIEDMAYMSFNIVKNEAPDQIVDVRASEAFDDGHIDGATNIPYGNFFDGRHLLKSEDELARLYSKSDINLGNPIISSCRIGRAACTNYLALNLLGVPQSFVYDGSWMEYSTKPAKDLKFTGSKFKKHSRFVNDFKYVLHEVQPGFEEPVSVDFVMRAFLH